MSTTSDVFSEILYNRLESAEHIDLLRSIDTHKRVQQQLNEAESLIPELVRKAIFEANQTMRDIELQIIYRAGVRDGINLKGPTFLTEGF